MATSPRLTSADAHLMHKVTGISVRLLDEVRNLPAAIAGAALHPPVAPARAFLNLQDRPEHDGIGRVSLIAPTAVTEGGRVHRVERVRVSVRGS